MLYNDPPLLLSILEMARVPERVERVALALDEGGPYVLITRSGRFVTCLAAGMKLDDVPVVSRKQLDDFTGKVGELRARFALAQSLVGTEKGGAQKLIGRLVDAGAALSREEFAALVLWQPFLVRDLLRALFRVVDYLSQTRENLAATRLGKRNRRVERVLHDYWKGYWATGHLAMMLAVGGAELFETMPEDLSEQCRSLFAWGTVRQGGIGLALRGSWAVGRLGKTMLPAAKQRVREAQSPTQYLTGALSLIALATRHASLRAEALKALGSTPLDTAFRGAPLLQQAVYNTTLAAFENPEETMKRVRLYAEASLRIRRAVHRQAPAPIPDERLLPVACLDVSNFHEDDVPASFLPALLSQVSKSSAEDLYLPSAEMSIFGYGPWRPDFSLALLEPLATAAARPAAATQSVGRNDPCACGSGKKSKKCCAG